MKKVTLAGKKAGRRRWLAAATAAARAVAEDWRSRFERDGISEEILLPCQTEGPAGTDLTGCGKVRVPPPGRRARDGLPPRV